MRKNLVTIDSCMDRTRNYLRPLEEVTGRFDRRMAILLLMVFGLGAVLLADGSIPQQKGNSGSYKRVCYFQKSHIVTVSIIPADLCTHIIFAFAVIKNYTIVPESALDFGAYEELIKKKKINPNLKVMVSLQDGFPPVAHSSAEKMAQFSHNAVNFLRKNKLDGVDFDWEVPLLSEKASFALLLKVFRSVIDEEAFNSRQQPLLFSIALVPSIHTAKEAYDIPVVSSVVDFATAMTYDYHHFIKNVSAVTAYNSPLFTAKYEAPIYSVNASITYFLGAGMDRNKLLLGFPTYGRSFTLQSADRYNLHAAAIGVGEPGPIAGIKGIYSYQDSCVQLKEGYRVWDDHSKVPYLHKGTAWASYEDEESITTKCTWLKSVGLAGAGVWSTAWDDYSGMCGSGKFPLLNTLRKELSHMDNKANISLKIELK